MKAFLYLTFFMLACSSTHAQKWRLVKQLDSNFSFQTPVQEYVLKSKLHYIYDTSKGRGGVPDSLLFLNITSAGAPQKELFKDTLQVAFDSSQYWTLYHNTLTLSGSFKRYYDPSGALSVEHQYGLINGGWGINKTDSTFYTAAKKDQVKKYDNKWAGNDKLVQVINYKYDSNNWLISVETFSRNTQPTDTLVFSDGLYFLYDNLGRVVKDSTVRQVYDTKLNKYAVFKGKRYVYTYNGNTALVSERNEYWQDTLSTKTKYYYDNNSRLIADTTFNLYTGKKTTIRQAHIYEYNTQGKVYRQYDIDSTNYPMHTARRRHGYYYNSLGLLTQWSDTLNATTGIFYRKTIYEYEMYWPDGITKTSKPQLDVQLFPNPAANNIQIKTSFEKTQNVKLSIMDMQGRVIKRITDRADKQYQRQIYLHDLSSGMYMLHIESEDAESYKQFIVQ